ncbi:MAG TPA: AMP-binding protein, partial [Herpetosiphonaceae bacterium]
MSEPRCNPLGVSSFVAILRWRASHQPDQAAYTFLADDTSAARLSYAELDRRACVIAAHLQAIGARGERALLLYPPGLEYIAALFGCLYAGVVAVPAYPPHAARHDRRLSRLRAIARDAQPLVALTTSAIRPMGATLSASDPSFHALRWLATDALAPGVEPSWQAPAVDSASLALLQYTSGSTATPKGVMLSHSNLLHNSSVIQRCFEHTSDSQGVIWLPPYHDMGLIGGILQPLYTGFPVVLMSPVSFLQRPLRWLQAISDYRATTSGGPNFAYELCLRKITPEQRERLDLSSWRVAFNGAEPIRAETLERFTAAFSSAGFRREALYPCYGLAEATLIVSGGHVSTPPISRAFEGAALEQGRVLQAASEQPGSRTLVGCGQAPPDQQIAIVEPQSGVRCQPGQIGEIWVAGPSVAQGYWNQPGETMRTFEARIADTGDGPFLRTGDLGFLHDGELFITGRIKDLIIIRGRNHYPQDIERTVEECHPALRPGSGAAFTIEVAGEERLIVAHEVERTQRRVEIAEVAAAIRQAVAEEHELHVYAVALLKHGGVPKTSSGKVQRHACRAGFVAGSLDLIGSDVLDGEPIAGDEERLTRETILALEPAARRLALTTYLQQQIARALGSASSQLQRQHPISAQGIDSLMAIELQHTIETDLGVTIPMVRFLQDLTIEQLAAEIDAQIAEPSSAPQPTPHGASGQAAEYPLSIGQRALWFLHELAPASAAYHITSAVRIRGSLDSAALHRAFQRLVDRHPSLRATFAPHGSDGQAAPVQRIASRVEVAFERVAAPESTAALDELLAAEALRPFDLRHEPPLRVRLFTRSASEHILLLVVHHIAADFWSLAGMIRELRLLYAAESAHAPPDLAPTTFRYVDYIEQQSALLAGPEGDRLWRYWQRRLADARMVLDLPTDRPRPAVQTYHGATHSFGLSPELTEQIKALAQNASATPYMVLLAAFHTLLLRYTGQHDILVGSPTAGRDRRELAEIVGYMVNPIVLRGDLSGNPTFATLLDQTRRVVLDAFAHQQYPFALLVERLQPQRDPSRSPLFQVMFVLQKNQRRDDVDLAAFALGVAGAQMTLADLTIESLALAQQATQVDLTLTMAEVNGSFVAAFEYNRDLFDTSTIARMAGHFVTLLDGIVADPGRRLASLPLLSAAERQQMLVQWNATRAPYPAEQCYHELFEQQAARTPDAIAVIAGDERLSYHELNARANQVAHELRILGVGPDVPVGICVERSAMMLIGLLGILKAGGAYVPLDPAYPQERMAFMLDDTRMPVLLTQQRLRARLPQDVARIIELDAAWPRIAARSAANPSRAATPDHLAYLIYTSGSTGTPKGAMIPHRGLVNYVSWAAQTYRVAQGRGTPVHSPIGFDLTVTSLLVPLAVGQRVHLLPDAQALDGLSAALQPDA